MKHEVSLKQKAYEYIKKKIVDCDYLPDTFINEKQLMDEIKISRTPIREALSKLEQENLVAILPKRGVAVKGLSVNEINMMFQTREAIETFLIRKEGKNIDRAALLALKARLSRDWSDQLLSESSLLDDDFHKLITSGSKNRYLLQVLDHLYIQLHRLRILNGRQNLQRLKFSQEEHLAIVDFLLAEDFEGAAEADRLHLIKAKEAAMDLILNK